MKDNAPVLYPTPEVGKRVTEYAVENSTKLPDYIKKYHDFGMTLPAAEYMTSEYQAAMMVWLARAVGAKRVLEIGVFIGFSAMAWSYAAGPDGFVTGLEFSKEYAGMARKGLQENGVKNVEIVEGDAAKTLADLNPEEPYDLIFIDADKPGYPNYLKLILEKSQTGSSNRILKKGGIILADNVLRRGLVADSSPENPNLARDLQDEGRKKLMAESIAALTEFNTALVSSPRLETVLLPLFDGLGMARLID
ncbi:O-methyltransferase MdmC [Pleurostoma richardsiae]|uniref:O-methyltransferase MdmC n=1 Tax=Pleurostoma richardsiae TaxID=41990 RepID=A0AA38S0C9_9PEZI|nr:O-methyltransferase MdmC [Pleurostoma richardsiae]